jgi:EGF domain
MRYLLLILVSGCSAMTPVDAGVVDSGSTVDAGRDAGFDAGIVDFTPPDAGQKCTVNNGGCHVSAKCTQLGTNTVCTCRVGFSGNGFFCNDVDECAVDAGGCSGACVNSDGGFMCQ